MGGFVFVVARRRCLVERQTRVAGTQTALGNRTGSGTATRASGIGGEGGGKRLRAFQCNAETGTTFFTPGVYENMCVRNKICLLTLT